MYAGVSLLLLFFYYCAYGFCKLISTMITNIFTFLLLWNIFSLKSFGFPCSPFLFKGNGFYSPFKKKKHGFYSISVYQAFLFFSPAQQSLTHHNPSPCPQKKKEKRRKTKKQTSSMACCALCAKYLGGKCMLV